MLKENNTVSSKYLSSSILSPLFVCGSRLSSQNSPMFPIWTNSTFADEYYVAKPERQKKLELGWSIDYSVDDAENWQMYFAYSPTTTRYTNDVWFSLRWKNATHSHWMWKQWLPSLGLEAHRCLSDGWVSLRGESDARRNPIAYDFTKTQQMHMALYSSIDEWMVSIDWLRLMLTLPYNPRMVR